MRQTWHIFLKDARRLRYEIGVMLILTAAYAWSQGHWQPFPSMRSVRLMETANLLRLYLLPIAWWFLCSFAVYGEPLVGNRQFWITRPYRRTSLLGAKLLFIAAFVSLPLLLADGFVLLLQGLRPWENPVGLAWHETAIFAVIILPMIAVACMTANFGQAVLMVLAAMVPLIVLGRFFAPFLSAMSEFGVSGFSFIIGEQTGWQTGVWLPLACLLAISGTLVIILVQYRNRCTDISRIIFAAVIGLVLCGGRFLPGGGDFTVQSPLFGSRVDTSSITPVFSPESSRPSTELPAPQNAGQDNFMHIKLPVRFEGAPPGTAILMEMMFADVTPPGGKPLGTWIFFGQDAPETLWHDGFVDRSVIEQLKGESVRVHLTIQLTVLGDPHTQDLPISDKPYRVPEIGVCESSSSGFRSFLLALNCRAAFRQPAYVLAQFTGPTAQGSQLRDVQWRTNYSPYPAEFGINPISDCNWAVPAGATRVTFTTMQPLAHIRCELNVPSVRLADFAH